ncbi:uridine monophosphate kinase [Labrenzia sp. PHM005]|uniref:uridine monophosphate kinase n=1 Tax=Labrenzia sp. PHM005 TaxID=2590016 RepID=UPI00113FCB29|nr:UMP kinase [Labrenzia sp. PHM005]QDG76027.1 UMP kinase [Labrenzia sp. PHM005]
MRLLVKVSGEALAEGSSGVFSDDAISRVTEYLVSLARNGHEVVVVVGGGNIFRGTTSSDWNIERVEADNVGMLGTIANGILLRAKIEATSDVEVRLMSAVDIPAIGEKYIRRRALRHLERGRLVLLSGGIGQPYVTTDYPSVQRAVELDCNSVLCLKNGIDGVYDSDPKLNADARRYKTLSIETAITNSLGFMDRSALVLAKQHDVHIHVIGVDSGTSVLEAVNSDTVGTRVSRDAESAFY